MIPEIRRKFNAEFSQAHYDAMIADINSSQIYPADFRISETPLFLSRALTDELLKASNTIIAQLDTDEYRARSEEAVPRGWSVPNEDAHTTFLQLDFAICDDGKGGYMPRLIELQGFPSLYCFQAFLDQKIRQYFDIPVRFACYFNGLDYESYRALLHRTIIGDADPENVILLEIEPETQKTRIDFACTEAMLGIRAVCLTKIIRKGNRLFYEREGREVPIERIYSRLIRDDPKLREITDPGWLSEPLDVHWVGHPNWYYKISKYSLPLLHNEYVPDCSFLDQLVQYPPDPENYVLKPLFQFSGAGIELDVTPELLDSIIDRQDYILQHKVEYAPLVETPDGYSRAEMRMLFIWENSGLQPVCNLVRMSKGRMMGVRFNRDKTWGLM